MPKRSYLSIDFDGAPLLLEIFSILTVSTVGSFVKLSGRSWFCFSFHMTTSWCIIRDGKGKKGCSGNRTKATEGAEKKNDNIAKEDWS
jgi:hypothetical protein